MCIGCASLCHLEGGICNVPPPRGRAHLHLVAFLGHSQPPQTNTSLFYTLCPHSCAPGKYFPVGHPSLNFSRPSTLRARLHLAAFLGHSQPPQTNTSLFYTLCPHSYAPWKYFLVGHPSLNFSRPSTLNFRVLWRWASGKNVATCLYESPINPIKP